VLEVLAEANLEGVSVHRIGMPDSFVEHGTADAQRHDLSLDAEGIFQQVLETFYPGGQPLSSHLKASGQSAAD